MYTFDEQSGFFVTLLIKTSYKLKYEFFLLIITGNKNKNNSFLKYNNILYKIPFILNSFQLNK